MIPGVSIITSVPNVDHIRKYNLDELLDAREVIGKIVTIISAEYIGSKLDIPQMVAYARSIARTIFQVQIECRGFPIDLYLLSEFANEISIEETTTRGHCNIGVPPHWEEKVNKYFRVWDCSRCSARIRDGRHSQEECQENIVVNVIEE